MSLLRVFHLYSFVNSDIICIFAVKTFVLIMLAVNVQVFNCMNEICRILWNLFCTRYVLINFGLCSCWMVWSSLIWENNYLVNKFVYLKIKILLQENRIILTWFWESFLIRCNSIIFNWFLQSGTGKGDNTFLKKPIQLYNKSIAKDLHYFHWY